MPGREYGRGMSFDDFRKRLEKYKAEDYCMAESGNYIPYPYWDLAECSEARETSFVQLSEILREDAAAKGADKDTVEAFIRRIDSLQREDDYNGMPILNRINLWLNEEENPNDGKIIVLPLMCGAGKSTAISQKIREVLSDPFTQGLLIVTDSIQRMHDYLEPYEGKQPELRRFLDAHKDEVCIWESGMDHRELAIKRQSCPVLIVSTQRFFLMSREAIQNTMLTWNNGPRPVIIFDEHIPLRDVIQISRTSINSVATVLCDGIEYQLAGDREDGSGTERLYNPDEFWQEKKWVIDQWELVRKKIYEAIEEYERLDDEKAEYSLYATMRSETVTEDDERFRRFLNANREAFFDNSDKPLEIINAVFRLFREGAVYHCAKVKGRYENVFSVTFDNVERILGLRLSDGRKPRVFLLDGTADIHPDTRYGNQEYIHLDEGRKFWRRLDGLTIHMVDEKTSKSMLHGRKGPETKRRKAIIEYLKTIWNCDPMYTEHTGQPVVFTYKAIESSFSYKKQFVTEHFNNIKGRNDFVEHTLIAQVGLNRLPEWYILSYYLTCHPELVEEIKQMSPRAQIDFFSQLRREDPDVLDLEVGFLLSDIEQNMFRCRIRKAEYVGRAHYFILTSKASSDYQPLYDKMYGRYHDDHGASIVEEVIPDELRAVIERGRPAVNRDPCIQWLLSQLPRRQFNYDIMAGELGISVQAIKDAKRYSSTLDYMFEQCREAAKEEKSRGNPCLFYMIPDHFELAPPASVVTPAEDAQDERFME